MRHFLPAYFSVWARSSRLWALAFIFPLGTASPLRADEPSAREVLRQAIAPIVDTFSRHPDGPNRALTLRWRVAEATAQPPELRGSHLAIVCQTPDDYFFQFLALDTVCTVCRHGQSVWVAPADRFAPLLQQVEQKPVTRADREPLEPITLTVPTRLFWILFYLFPVQDAGHAPLGAIPCRRVEFHPPDGKKGETIRMWVSGADTGTGQGPVKTLRVDLNDPDSHATLDVEELRLSPSVPASAFEPDASQKDSVLRVPVERYRALMTLFEKTEAARRKEFIKKAEGGGKNDE